MGRSAYQHIRAAHLGAVQAALDDWLAAPDAYPVVARAIAELPLDDVILDGEATGAWGRQGDADYHVFDVLWLNGRDVTSLPLHARRALLGEIPFLLPIARVIPLDEDAPWERACREG